jgi:hypothetical protein
MIVTTIGDVLRGCFHLRSDQQDRASLLEEHCIYRFRDGNLVLYIGQSKKNIRMRIGNHLGLYAMPGTIALQRLILANLPQAYEWQIDLFTREDCQKRMQFNAGRFAGLSLYEAAQVHQLEHTIDYLEQRMIQCYRPCLNIAHNPTPTPLPEHYRLPVSELLDGIVCTSHPDPRAYQISYSTYDFASQQNKEYTITMYGGSSAECRELVTYLLGYKPEGLRIRAGTLT